MLQKRRTKSEAAYLVAAVLLGLYVTQTEAYRLSKTEKQDGWKETTQLPATNLQPGVIVFGEGLKNDSVDPAYQADFPGMWPKWREAEFNRMSPSLQCGHDHMRFRAAGAPVKHFALNQYPSLPLSHVPTDCGYTMEGSPLRLVLHVPYDGCNVVIQDGNYNLPLHWHGISVTLKCPNPDDGSTSPIPFFPWFPGMPLPQEPTTSAPQIPPGLLQHFMHHWPALFPQDPVPHVHKGLWPYYFAHWHQLAQTTTPSPQDPAPEMPPNYWQYLYYMHKTSPQDQVSQLPFNYWQHPHGHFPKGHFPHWQHPHGHFPHWQHPHGHFPKGHFPHWQHPHGHFPKGHFPHWQHPHGHFPKGPVVPTQSGQVPWFGPKWWSQTTTSATTTSETTTPETTTETTRLPWWMPMP